MAVVAAFRGEPEARVLPGDRARTVKTRVAVEGEAGLFPIEREGTGIGGRRPPEQTRVVADAVAAG